MVECFDFAVYGFLATYIAAVFFPSGNPTASLLATFAVFGAAFFVRPLGGLFFGPIGDKLGRQRVLALVIIRSEEHTSELQSRQYLVCRLLLEKKKKKNEKYAKRVNQL